MCRMGGQGRDGTPPRPPNTLPREKPGTNPGTSSGYHPTALPIVGPYALPVPGLAPVVAEAIQAAHFLFQILSVKPSDSDGFAADSFRNSALKIVDLMTRARGRSQAPVGARGRASRIFSISDPCRKTVGFRRFWRHFPQEFGLENRGFDDRSTQTLPDSGWSLRS